MSRLTCQLPTCFASSAFRDDPETKKYGLWMHHIPLFYAGPTKTDLQIS